MINTIAELNKFVEKEGIKAQGQLLPRLIERKELISSEIAKLIQPPVSDSKRLYF